jgi:hypothetical protein
VSVFSLNGATGPGNRRRPKFAAFAQSFNMAQFDQPDTFCIRSGLHAAIKIPSVTNLT